MVELTVQQALQQAVAAHKEGKLQDAERLYRAILKSTPSHPDANHNLGVLAVSVNKTDAALPLFKTALEANPKIEQFWLSYIDCLIKTERVDDARRVLSEAQQYGLTAAKLQVFEVQLGFEPSLSIDTPNQEFGNQLQSHQDELSPAVEFREAGKYQEAQEWLRNRIERDGKNAEALSLLSQVFLLDNKGSEAAEVLAEAASMSPELPSVYRNQARLFLKQSKIIEALEMAQLGCQHLPADPESLLVLAACLSANERDLEALPIIEELLEANSNYAEAYANRAIIKLRAKDTNGAIEDAEMSVSLKPHLTQMWKILSSLYQADNNLSDAIEALRNAHQNEPENTDLMIHLGTLLRQNNEAPEAIPLLEKATEVASKNASAWTNLGAALQQENRITDAKKAYQQALALNPKSTSITSKLVAMAVETGEWELARRYLEKALEIEPNIAETHGNLGNVYQELGKFKEAEASYLQAIALKPDLAGAHSNLGNTLKELGRLNEAEASYRQAIALKSDFAEAHGNLGLTLQELGRFDEALASCNQAIAVKPDYAEAHYNSGITLQRLGRLDEAKASYLQAIALKADYAEAHNNLGGTLQELGRLDEAIASYVQAIALKSDYAEAYANLGIAIKSVRFNSSSIKLYAPLTHLVSSEIGTRPSDVADSVVSLLKHDIQIKDLLLKKNAAVSLDDVTSTIRSLHKLPLLHRLMRVCPLPDLQLEKLFVAMRRLLIVNIDNLEAVPELIYFLSTLSIHCFINEYVYIESDEEAHLISELQAKISKSLAKSEQPEVIKVLCLASYRPLHQYEWCQRLKSLESLAEVNERLIKEPLIEKIIAKDIPVLEAISDDVSLKVRGQYEENPWPRWVKAGVSIKAKPIAAVCDELKLRLHSDNIKNVIAPSILIAGCGTGQHAIGTASRFTNCHVTAVDLSLASLAYAQRKSNELRFTNIDYLQADILHLYQVGKEFDIIESAGVLHHMEEPMTGWRALVELLKPSGLMRIGLYSALARQHVAQAREEITALGVETSQANIREFRQTLAESRHEHHQQLTKSSNFFSLSGMRDLIFHVQEHRFTLSQIKNSLDELGLKFCGFEVQGIDSRFTRFYGETSDIHDLALWDEFEKSNPHAFTGMYEFWCQKP